MNTAETIIITIILVMAVAVSYLLGFYDGQKDSERNFYNAGSHVHSLPTDGENEKN